MSDTKTREAAWAEAKRKCRLNVETVRMAKEMGLNPRKLMKNIPSKSQPWKAPVHEWIRDMYEKRQRKSAERKARRDAVEGNSKAETGEAQVIPFQQQARLPGESGIFEDREPVSQEAMFLAFPEDEEGDPDFPDDVEDPFNCDKPLEEPTDEEIAEEDRRMLRRRDDFRAAAEHVTGELAQLGSVQKVVLFGSVALPLEKEVPRFREFRLFRVAIWHECWDVDLAVWVSDLANLRSLQKARSRALNRLLEERQIGVAHHQVEIFLMDPGSNTYLGRLCAFGQCPKGKEPCQVSGCGVPRFVKVVENFKLRDEALAADRSVVLFDRQSLDYDASQEEIPF